MSEWFVKGGPVMWPLLALSLAAVALIVERFLFWFRERRRPASAAVVELLAAHPEVGNGGGETDLEFPLRVEERRLERGMAVLDTIITAAPLLGILGTVLGIIDSFELLSARSVQDPLAVTGGVAEALITTASGLVIALGVIFPYNYFRTLVRDRLGALEHEMRRRLEGEERP
ncbi:MAG: MotA/TolQ/ExbB proton channel family protein [Planctomycetota bacterium]